MDSSRPDASRRQFCLATASALGSWALARPSWAQVLAAGPPAADLAKVERARVMEAADRYLRAAPVTITSYHSSRSAGGAHDYFSEGDYWWPDPAHPDGPYIQRDGLTNPDNFVSHRRALMQFSVQLPALTAAWVLTRNRKYARHAANHLRAWFLSTSTRMNPNLQYAQAIHGRTTGRGIGVIDTIHLVEVARAIPFLRDSTALSPGELDGVEEWFREYVHWMTNSPNGLEEREAVNNHGTCWVMQVAQFARLTRDETLLEYCRDRYRKVLVPNQIAPDGSFPLELKRTKPYSYCLFNLDVMATVCQILSSGESDLWSYRTEDGRGIRHAVEYMYPYILDKQRWPHPPDVQFFDQFPVRQPSLLFAGRAYSQQPWIELWSRLNPDPTVEEVIRNYPIRQPVLWI